jgi:hypothetical protein
MAMPVADLVEVQRSRGVGTSDRAEQEPAWVWELSLVERPCAHLDGLYVLYVPGADMAPGAWCVVHPWLVLSYGIMCRA